MHQPRTKGSATAKHQPLLGRLAEFGWFSRHGEVAATQALALVLEENQLRAALLKHLGDLTETDLREVASFEPELVHEDRARPDLEGHDSRGRPLVIVEAKFGAELNPAQVSAYLRNQEARLENSSRGALVLLVPSYRVPEANALLDALRHQDGSSPQSITAIATGVDTWDEWLDVLSDATQKLPAAKRDALRSDLDQLQGLCATMRAVDIPPLGFAATGHDLEDRQDDLRRLVAEATARYRPRSGRLIPIGEEPYFHYYRRYIPGGLSEEPDCCCSVGAISGLPSEGQTPFWLRYHRDTPGFRIASDRITASHFAADAQGDGGHTWLPLRVSSDRSGAALIEELCAQIDEIRAVVGGNGSSQV